MSFFKQIQADELHRLLDEQKQHTVVDSNEATKPPIERTQKPTKRSLLLPDTNMQVLSTPNPPAKGSFNELPHQPQVTFEQVLHEAQTTAHLKNIGKQLQKLAPDDDKPLPLSPEDIIVSLKNAGKLDDNTPVSAARENLWRISKALDLVGPSMQYQKTTREELQEMVTKYASSHGLASKRSQPAPTSILGEDNLATDETIDRLVRVLTKKGQRLSNQEKNNALRMLDKLWDRGTISRHTYRKIIRKYGV